jgi:hypothetical protein|tara:strand:+ start:9558 stop:9680 length:123 start_codon:yes stop_codon:yes gene_type:complete
MFREDLSFAGFEEEVVKIQTEKHEEYNFETEPGRDFKYSY